MDNILEVVLESERSVECIDIYYYDVFFFCVCVYTA